MKATARQIHIIDDDDAVRDSLGALLEAAGYDVKTYGSGLSFLEGLTGEENGCVITDVLMPGMTGVELTARLRRIGSALPIIVITGNADIPLAVQAMKAGAHEFIEKPFDDSTLLQAVETALARSGDADRVERERLEAVQRIGILSVPELKVLRGLAADTPDKVDGAGLGHKPARGGEPSRKSDDQDAYGAPLRCRAHGGSRRRTCDHARPPVSLIDRPSTSSARTAPFVTRGRRPQPDITAYQAVLRRIAVAGRWLLHSQGKSDAEIDAEIA